MIAWILTTLVITTGSVTELPSNVQFDTLAECQASGEMVIDSIEGERSSRVITVCTPTNA